MALITQSVAAGGVCMRNNEFGYQLLLVRRDKYNDWSLPKGKVEPGETRQAAAVREVKEETGIDARIAASLGPIDYTFTYFEDNEEANMGTFNFHRDKQTQVATASVHKTVYYYLMVSVGGMLGEFANHDEINGVRWFTIPEAQELLTHEGDLTTLARAVDLLTKAGGRGRFTLGDDVIGTGTNPRARVANV